MLTHTPHLRVPHDRLRVASLQQTTTCNGVAFTARLELDGEPVGTIVNDGNGGETTLYSTTSQFGWRRMRAYVEACRHRGQPVPEERVLYSLVTEYDLNRRLRRAWKTGGTLARLLDRADYILGVHHVWPTPRTSAALTEVGRQLAEAHPHERGVVWQIWAGDAWSHLTGADTATPADEAVNDGRPVDPMRIFAHLIADALLDKLIRSQLIDHAAGNGIRLAPTMSDARLRAGIRAHAAAQARRRGLPVDDLPRLSADEGLELGRLLAGGQPRPAPHPTNPDQH
jgi:hypothetical protein